MHNLVDFNQVSFKRFTCPDNCSKTVVRFNNCSKIIQKQEQRFTDNSVRIRIKVGVRAKYLLKK